ncbi:fimbria/pilus periplasmic chaperone [Novosphingobium sp. SL115]|uniref:fimbrial biogenesis chaperone n=1 Tax=Novosphingobium sp. SL115 TaxID=2995150 RepID=UPI0022744B94|nr:fimbria/pilus periplasmic chaperone [Novosphingobium sp. SL115]MCY1669425.1 fimbria/pilus periplasmic chaperone [Novosphingobium sp. SL115]
MLAMYAQSAQAGALRVMPVRVEVAAGRQFCALTLGNDADRPVTVQVRGFAWTRDDTGLDTLDPVDAPVVNPAIMTIPVGGSRLVRCSLPRQVSDGKSEQQWRLIVDELPLPSSEVAPGTVQTLLRLSVPVFRTADHAKPQLEWSMQTLPDKAQILRITNSGTRRTQVIRVMLHLRNGRDVPLDRSFYLLAKGAMILRVPTGIATEVLSVTAETDLGTLAVVSGSGSDGAPDSKLALLRPSER